MFTQTTPFQELEVNKQVRQESLTFLNQHAIIPDLVYMSANGWVEAIYDVPVGDKSILRTWNQLEADGLVQLAELPRYQPNTNNSGQINVNFKIITPVHSIWQRIINVI